MTSSAARRANFTACLITLVSTIGVALPYPVLAPLLAGSGPAALLLDSSWPPKLQLGVALAINPLGMLIGSALLGRWSDRFGRRRMLSASLLLGLAGHLASGWALARGSFAGFVLARFVTGLGEGNVAIARAIVADLHPLVDRRRAFGMLNSATFLGWLGGPLIGGLSLPLGATVPFWIATCSLIPALLLTRLALPADPSRDPGMVVAPELPVLWSAHPGLRQLLALQLMYTFGLNAFYEFYPLWLVESSAAGGPMIGLVTAVLCVLMTVTSAVIWPRWSVGRHPLQAAAHAMLVFAGLLALLPLARHWPAIVLIALSGLPIALYSAALPLYVSERYGALGQGRVMGWLSTVFFSGNLLIALAGGVLSLVDTRAVLWLGAVCIVSAWWLLRGVRRLDPGAPTAATTAPGVPA